MVRRHLRAPVSSIAPQPPAPSMPTTAKLARCYFQIAKGQWAHSGESGPPTPNSCRVASSREGPGHRCVCRQTQAIHCPTPNPSREQDDLDGAKSRASPPGCSHLPQPAGGMGNPCPPQGYLLLMPFAEEEESPPGLHCGQQQGEEPGEDAEAAGGLGPPLLHGEALPLHRQVGVEPHALSEEQAPAVEVVAILRERHHHDEAEEKGQEVADALSEEEIAERHVRGSAQAEGGKEGGMEEGGMREGGMEEGRIQKGGMQEGGMQEGGMQGGSGGRMEG